MGPKSAIWKHIINFFLIFIALQIIIIIILLLSLLLFVMHNIVLFLLIVSIIRALTRVIVLSHRSCTSLFSSRRKGGSVSEVKVYVLYFSHCIICSN